MKKIISAVLILASVCVLFSSCGGSSKKSESYVTDAEREAHIADLIGNGELIAENVASIHTEVDSMSGTTTEYTVYTWTVNQKYAETVGQQRLAATGKISSKSKDGLESMTFISENNNFSFYMDVSSKNPGDFAIVDKKTGCVYHSNPSIASSTYSNLKFTDATIQAPAVSAISLEAYDISNKRYEFNTIEDCIADLNLKIVRTGDNTIRVIYTIGKDPDKDLVPTVISEGTWNWIVGKLSQRSDGAVYIDDLGYNYKKITPSTVTIEEKETLSKYYPTIETDTLYIARGMTMRQRQLVKEAMQAAGFTVEMLKKEMDKVEYSGPARAVMYTIPVDITLEDNGVVINVDSSLILAPSKQKLYKMTLYRSFGSYAPNSKLENEQYMIVPDGSGAIISAEGNLSTDMFTGRVYGEDYTFQADLDTTKSAQIVSPFLIFDRSDVGGLLAVMESGAAQAYATARPANTSNNPGASINFDVIYTERDYRTYSGGQGSTSDDGTTSTTSSGSSGIVLSKESPTTKFVIRYMPTAGNKTYSEYAKLYRDYLISNGKLSSVSKAEDKTAMYVELLASINKAESIGGIPRDVQKSLTNYSQVKEIVDALSDAGITNVNVRYTAWANGGFYNIINDKVRLINELGKKSELTKLTDYLKSIDVGFYTDADFLYVYKDVAGDSLNYTQDTARRLDMRIGRVYKRNLATGQTESDASNVKSILSADLMTKIAQKYKASLENVIDTKQISFGNIGSDINSNYKVGRIISRETSLNYQKETISLFTGYDKMFTTGNDYVWADATHILNLPQGSSDYMTEDYSIPFIQMILHGYVNYSGKAVNKTSDYVTEFLKCLETGSGVSVQWMAADNSVFNTTELVDLYSLKYTDSFDRVVDFYKKVSAVLDKVSKLAITNHEYVDGYLAEYTEESVPAARIAATTYGDKYTIYVNYSDVDYYLANGTAVPAMSYAEVTK